MTSLKDQIEPYKSTLGIVAVLCTALFFTYKWFDGWMSVNMDVAVTAHRTRYSPGTDLLVVQVDLAKGEHSSINLLDGRARISFPFDSTCAPRLAKLYGLDRVSLASNQPDWQPSRKKYGVSPREKLELASVFEVPSAAVVVVDVMIVGKAKLSLRGGKPQWRSAAVSGPIDSTAGAVNRQIPLCSHP
jgi:hypothetical protein